VLDNNRSNEIDHYQNDDSVLSSTSESKQNKQNNITTGVGNEFSEFLIEISNKGSTSFNDLEEVLKVLKKYNFPNKPHLTFHVSLL
jgi:hypothetical protein